MFEFLLLEVLASLEALACSEIITVTMSPTSFALRSENIDVLLSCHSDPASCCSSTTGWISSSGSLMATRGCSGAAHAISRIRQAMLKNIVFILQQHLHQARCGNPAIDEFVRTEILHPYHLVDPAVGEGKARCRDVH